MVLSLPFSTAPTHLPPAIPVTEADSPMILDVVHGLNGRCVAVYINDTPSLQIRALAEARSPVLGLVFLALFNCSAWAWVFSLIR